MIKWVHHMSTSHLQVAGFTRRFRNAAREFREFPNDGHVTLVKQGKDADGQPCEIIEGEKTADMLKEVCGVWLIEAYKLGLIPASEKALNEYISFHTATNTPLPKGVQAQYLRCAHNLFCDVVGGNVVSGTLEGIDERGRIKLSNQRETGGLLPRIDQQHLNQTIPERFAAACEYLADLIESAGKMRSKTVP